MAKYSKFNIVYQLQKWMDSVAGQTFMNYAYSWGAAIVILGTLFKLTHLDGANLMLFIGMGTEVFVFFISAFDRPFDKTADGMELATDSQIAAALANAGSEVVRGNADVEVVGGNASGVIAGNAGGTVIIGGGNAAVQSGDSIDSDGGTVIIGQGVVPPMGGGVVIGGGNGAAPITFEGEESVAGTPAIGAPAPAVTPETAQAMEEATTTYVDRLNELNELLTKIGDLNKRLTIDSEEMETLNRTLTGIARVYEMQLKSASKQITTQDAINEQTATMAERIAELNSCYARMIEAMTPNIPKNS
ncbi:MAG: gliding motility protein GldL [Prevotella sp.]|nr:gliding motility protein GldL [Prevotella sp.]